MLDGDALATFLQQEDIASRPLSKQEEWRVLASWSGAFLPEFYALKGKNPPSEHLIDEFSASWIQKQSGARADEAYTAQSATEFFLLFWETNVAPVQCTARSAPTIALLRDLIWRLEGCDLSITDAEFRWTYVLTHEEYAYFSFAKRDADEVVS